MNPDPIRGRAPSGPPQSATATQAALSREAESRTLAELKRRLLREIVEEEDDEPLAALLRHAAAEAEAQAWANAFPLLLFPTLLEEKIGQVRRYITRQRRLQRHGSRAQ